MMKDLDNWIGNLYFEIEKVNLMDIAIEPKTEKLYYQPISGVIAKEKREAEQQAEQAAVAETRQFGSL